MIFRILILLFPVVLALHVNAQTAECPDSCTFYIPNTLTPDCDRANCEILEIISDCPFESFKFKLFNRWGEVIFESNDPEKKFDSTDQKEGTYYWLLEGKFCNKKDAKGNGYITILR